MQLPSFLRPIFASLTRLYPREHGKYSILTRLYFPWFGASAPTRSVFRTSHGFRLNGDLTEYLQAWIYIFGSYELPTVRFIRSYLRTGDTAVDVGAQIGYLTLVMATAADRTTAVISFEPESSNIARFNANMELNGVTNVTLIEKAVSEHEGMLKLYLSADENAGTHSTVFVEGNVSERFVEIPATTLDAAIGALGQDHVDLVKIDVEGGEIDVIKGAERVLEHHRPVVIAELSDALQRARGSSCQAFKEYMKDYGYEAFTIADSGALVPSALDAAHPMDNVVFVPDSRRDRVTIA